MSDLSTLDATRPADGDPVNAGASRMREERAAILGSFGIEHALAGFHKFLLSNFVSLPAAGTAGRIAINNTPGGEQLYLDNGTAWQVLHPFWTQFKTDANSQALSAGVWTDVLTDNINVNSTSTYLALVAINLVKLTALTQFTFKVLLAGAETSPTNRSAPTYSAAVLPDVFTYYTWAYAQMAAGTSQIKVQVNAGAAATKSSCSIFSIAL